MLGWYGFRFEEDDGAWGPHGPATQNGFNILRSPFYSTVSGFVRLSSGAADYVGAINWQWSTSALADSNAYEVGFRTTHAWVADVGGKGSFGNSLRGSIIKE